MVRTLSKALALTAGAWLAAPASAFTVFACEPEWAALTRVLVPDATLHVATHAAQDPHHIEARPALIAQMRNADLVVCTGAALEVGWLPMLQQRSGNAKAQDAFFAASHVSLIDAKPGAIAGPWSGDVHAEGNPHVHADPHRLLKVANALARRLQQELPSQREAIEGRRSSFEAKWSSHISGWEQRAVRLRGKTVAAQHTGFGYVWQWLGLRQVADLEPQPGMAPTPGHLQRLLGGLKAQPPMAIVVASYQDPRSGRWVAAQLDGRVPLLILPATVADDAAGDELVAWMDGLVAALLKAESS